MYILIHTHKYLYIYTYVCIYIFLKFLISKMSGNIQIEHTELRKYKIATYSISNRVAKIIHTCILIHVCLLTYMCTHINIYTCIHSYIHT